MVYYFEQPKFDRLYMEITTLLKTKGVEEKDTINKENIHEEHHSLLRTQQRLRDDHKIPPFLIINLVAP